MTINRKYPVIGVVLLVLGFYGVSNGQTPAITASTGSPLTAATLDGGQVALLLSGGAYTRNVSDIRDAVTVSGIAGVTVERVNRLGDTAVALTLAFSGYLAADGTLIFTVGAQALANYDGAALTAELSVAAVEMSLTASTPFGLWESSLNGSVVTLTLVGGAYERTDIRHFVAVSGLAGVTVDSQLGIVRASDVEVTVELIYLGDFVAPMAADGTLTFTVHSQAIVNYSGPALTVEVPVTAGIGPFDRNPDKDFNALSAAGNRAPLGLWSDGVTMWVVDSFYDKLYAYDLSTRARDPSKDFDTLGEAGNDRPRGLWSNGITMWVVDSDWPDDKIYAYDLSTKGGPAHGDFINTPSTGNEDPTGLWSDGVTMWVADGADVKLYAYDLSTRARDPSKDFNTLWAAGNRAPWGLWSDGVTMWVADGVDDKLYAYDLSTRARDPSKDFDTLGEAGNDRPRGLWSDGTTMWVADAEDGKLYAYVMPKAAASPDLVVHSLRGSDVTPIAGASFTLSATVRNQGTARSLETTLRFYRSTAPAISMSDTVVGFYPVSSLAAAESSDQSIDITAPSGSGAYYFRACVESLSVEANTRNNCSSGVAVVFGRDPDKDINTLGDAGNEEPWGIWSDGVTMWVADAEDDKLYAYNMASRTRDPSRDFDTLRRRSNSKPRDIWSDGATMWVVDLTDEKLYAYDMASRTSDPSRDFDTLDLAGNENPWGIWSDGSTMWVADQADDKVYAYDMSTRARDPSKDFNTLRAAGNSVARGLLSDGTTMWVADAADDKLYAYDLSTRTRDPDKDFNVLGAAGNRGPSGLWSDGTTLWVADSWNKKIYAYVMPSGRVITNTGTSGAPDIRRVTSSGSGLSIAWNAQPGGGSAVTAYDLRYIRSGARDKADAQWTVVEDVWTPGSGALGFELTGLMSGVQYDVQVRAVVGAANGPWSATSTGTPSGQSKASADFNGDGIVNFADFFDFVDAFGSSDAKYDLDGNGTVDFPDFFEFVDAFGTSG